MAIDTSIADQMLNPFRDMIKDLETKNLKGQDFNELYAILQKMEGYAAEMNDLLEFSTRMMTEGLYADFSEKYSKIMMTAAQNPQQT